MTNKERCEYLTVIHIIYALSLSCAASPNKIIELLTGYLWDEEESNLMKKLIKDELK